MSLNCIPVQPEVANSRVYRGAVEFKELPEAPHPQHERAVVRFSVRVPGGGPVLGTILRVTRTDACGHHPWWQWVYLPSDPGDPPFADNSSIFRILERVRAFHRITVRPKRRRSVVRGDEDEFESAVLEWCGQDDAWSGLEADYSVVKDVLWDCPSAELRSSAWDVGFPGRSGVYYRLFASDATKLKEEIATRIRELRASAEKKTAVFSKRGKRSRSLRGR